jgi:hypothetical protein
MQIFTYGDIPDEPKIDCEIVFSSCNYGNIENLSLIAGIETRGRSASSRPKQSFGLEIRQENTMLSKNISFLGMRNDDDWILDALYIDKARMRYKLSMDLWRDICKVTKNEKVHGKPYAASEYIEVFVNDDYKGIYTLGEKIDSKQLELAPTDNIKDVVLYKTEVWTPSTRFEELIDTTSSPHWDGWVQLIPEPEIFSYWQPAYSFTDLVINGYDSDFETQIEQYLDINNLIDYFIFINTCKGFDNMGTNMFYARQSMNEPFIIYPWDLDATWGRNWDSTYLPPRGIQSNLYYNRPFNLDVNNFNTRILNRWNDLKTELFFATALHNRFRDNAEILIESGALRREKLRWPEMHLNMDNELEYLDTWIDERIEYLDEYFTNLPENDE